MYSWKNWEARRRSHSPQVSHLIHWLSHHHMSHESSPAGVQTARRRRKAGWQGGTANQWREPKGKTFWEAARAEGQQQGLNPSFRYMTELHPDFMSWFVRKKYNFSLHIWQNSWAFFFSPSVPTFLHQNYREATEQALTPCFPSQRSTQHLQAVFLSPQPRAQRTQEQCWCSNSSSSARDKAVSAFLLWTLLISVNNIIWIKSFSLPTSNVTL